MFKKIIRTNSCDYYEVSAKEICSAINECLAVRPKCNFFLTGGKSVGKLYETLATKNDDFPAKDMNFFLSDERFLNGNLNYHDTNFFLCNKYLSGIIHNNNNQIRNIDQNSLNIFEAAKNYDALLPSYPDIILLSLGHDEHLASIFPEYELCESISSKLIISRSIDHPYDRISISKNYLLHSEIIIILVLGSRKIKALERLINGRNFIYLNNFNLGKKTIIITDN